METFLLRMESFKEKQQFHRRETLMDSEFQNRFPNLIFKGPFKKSHNQTIPENTSIFLRHKNQVLSAVGVKKKNQSLGIIQFNSMGFEIISQKQQLKCDQMPRIKENKLQQSIRSDSPLTCDGVVWQLVNSHQDPPLRNIILNCFFFSQREYRQRKTSVHSVNINVFMLK